MTVCSRLYEHPDYNGRSTFIHLPNWQAYAVLRDLGLAQLQDMFSSAEVTATGEELSIGSLIVFEHPGWIGRYGYSDAAPGHTQGVRFSSWINDRTSSLILTRRLDPQREIAGPLGQFGIRDQVRDLLQGVPHVTPRGNPIVTWDMWPDGSNGHPFDPTRGFVYIRIPVEIGIPNVLWVDYDAEIRFWVYPYIDSSGTLLAYTAYWGYWVEGGAFTDSIVENLGQSVPGFVETLNNRLNALLGLARAAGPYELTYLLPGSGTGSGHTDDGVTLMLLKRPRVANGRTASGLGPD